MREEPLSLDSVESALRELGEAERAGVFRRTPVEGVLPSATPARGYRMHRAAKGWIAAAAAFAFLAVSWSLIFYREFGEMRERLADSSAQAQAHVLACVSGPASGAPADCGSLDADGDGDFDLADWRSHQIAVASAHR